MGSVYRAHDTKMRRDVAVKVLEAKLATEPGYRERFQREAYTAARLTEPHIIPIYEADEIDGRLYLSMPIIDGIDVHDLLKRDGPMSPLRAVTVIEQLAAALNAAHGAGLVHRDVKPSNALMTDDDFVYLIDFGIAHDVSATRLTDTGTMVGTMAYMAPERFDTGAADARSDVYALACVLYECLTGDTPFRGHSVEQQIAGHLTLDPPKPSGSNPAIAAGFDEVIARGMAKDPDQRYQAARELATAARDALAQTPAGDRGAATTVLDAQVPHPSEMPTPEIAQLGIEESSQPRRLRRLTLALAAAAVVILAAAVTTVVVIAGQKETLSTQAPTTTSYLPQVILPFRGLNLTASMTADAAGDIYVGDGGQNGRVLKLAAHADTPFVLPFSNVHYPDAVGVDAVGNVYVADFENNRVLKLPAGADAQSVLPFTGLKGPTGVSVDGAGNVYVTDSANKRVLKLAAGATASTVLPLSNLKAPGPVAVDTVGNIYLGDGRNRVLKVPAGASTPIVLPFAGVDIPAGVAVDTAGNVYVADYGNYRVLKLPAGGTAPRVLPFTDLQTPMGVAADSAGNVYVLDSGMDRVLKLPIA